MSLLEELKPTIGMIGIEVMYAGITVSTRAAFVNGLNPMVFIVYRLAVATLCIAPFALSPTRTKMSGFGLGFRSFCWIFLSSLVGITSFQNLYFGGIDLASSSATAIANLTPAITFVMAYVAGIEKVRFQSLRSIAKIIGTIVSVTGVVSMALLKGPKLLNSELVSNKYNMTVGRTWLLGCVLLFASACCWSLWLVLQVPVSKVYPDKLSLTAWMCFMATLQCAVVTLVADRDLKAWKLGYNELLCSFFAGAGSATQYFVLAWCISRRGPLFCALFNPLSTILVTVFAALFLHEEMYTGSLLGGIAVIIGLYAVLWGQAKDLENNNMDSNQIESSSSNSQSNNIDLEQPFLNHNSPNLHQ